MQSIPKVTNREKELATLLRVVGDNTRLSIVCTLLKTPSLCVREISKELGLSDALSSHHLKELERVHIVSAKREGKMICYSMQKTPRTKDLVDFLCKHGGIKKN